MLELLHLLTKTCNPLFNRILNPVESNPSVRMVYGLITKQEPLTRPREDTVLNLDSTITKHLGSNVSYFIVRTLYIKSQTHISVLKKYIFYDFVVT